MDVARELLNNLMGRDRNKPKGDTSGRDHYSNRDVCKPYLICFCFNTLFPNTIYDQGPCNKRHDTYLKNMFDNDLNRKDHEKQYIKQCINWIQKRLIDVQQKIKKNQQVIETKTTFTGDRPKGILDRIIAIEQDIQNMMKQAEIFGQQGQIDDSARCLEQVQRLRQRKRQIQSMNDTSNNVQKQQKICETCGAIQTINDTQKRIQTHLQGKIHQGFLKLRHQVEALKIRLQIITQMDPKQMKQRKQKENQKENRQKEREKERERQRQRQKQKEKQRQKEKQKEKQRQREKQRDKERQKERIKDPQSHKRKSYEMLQEKVKDNEKDKDKEKRQRSHSHKKKKDKDRQRSREKKHKKQKEDKHHNQYRQDNYGQADRSEKKKDKKHKKDRSREKQRSRDKHPERDERDRIYHG